MPLSEDSTSPEDSFLDEYSASAEDSVSADDSDSSDDVSELFLDGESSHENGIIGDDKIIGGIETTIESHPHQISLRWRNEHICGGSILTPTRGLTAAHCINVYFSPSEYNVMAGSTLRMGSGNHDLTQIMLAFCSGISH